MATSEAAKMSRMLFAARENLSMWGDVVTARTGKIPTSVLELVEEIDAYRAEHGWSPNGFGGEADPEPPTLEQVMEVVGRHIQNYSRLGFGVHRLARDMIALFTSGPESVQEGGDG